LHFSIDVEEEEEEEEEGGGGGGERIQACQPLVD